MAPSAGHGYGGATGMNGHGNGHGATVEGTAVLLRDQLRRQLLLLELQRHERVGLVV